jgi:hypothetical protein
MKGGQLFDGEKSHVEEEIGEFKKVGEESYEPTKPCLPVEGVTDLKEDINKKDG